MKNHEQIDLIDLRIFRAIDEPELTDQFSSAFNAHLKILGVDGISSADDSWKNNPNVYVFSAYMDGSPVGGARLQLFHSEHDYPLISAMSSSGLIPEDYIADDSSCQHAEACALWVSFRYRGLGLPAFLSASTVSFAHHLGLDKLYAICPRHTLDEFRKLGFIMRFDGDDILEFDYPTDSITSYLIEADVRELAFAQKEEKRLMRSQLKKPEGVHAVNGKIGDVLVRMNGFPEVAPCAYSKEGVSRHKRWTAPDFSTNTSLSPVQISRIDDNHRTLT